MSCDFAVWHPSRLLTSRQAGELYTTLCDGDLSGVVAHPSVGSFYADVTAKHPEIDAIPEDRIGDFDYCPWSIAFDRSPAHLIMCCVWPKAEYVGDLLLQLASSHGLVIYDPQSERVHFPLEPANSFKRKRSKFWQ